MKTSDFDYLLLEYDYLLLSFYLIIALSLLVL